MPPDQVADAGDRHVLLVERHREELVVGEREGMTDHPGDVQLPGGRVNTWDEQRGVDPVEVRVRHDQRREARGAERLVGRQGRHREERRGDLRRAHDGVRVLSVEERAAGVARDDHAAERPGARDQEPPTGPFGRAAIGHAGVRAVCDGRALRERQEAQEGGEARRRGDARVAHRQRLGRERVTQRGRTCQEPERYEDGLPDPVAPRGQDPGPRGDGERHDQHRDAQGDLVVRAEQVRHQVLGARRLEADHERPHRGDQ